MSLSRIRAQIEALQRKFALPLAVVRARRVAEDICDQWTVASTGHQPLPEPFAIVRKVADAGIHNVPFTALHRYIRDCLETSKCPNPKGVLNALIPQAAKAGLIASALS